MEPPHTTEVSSVCAPSKTHECEVNSVASSSAVPSLGKQPQGPSAVVPGDLSVALLAQQLPPLPKFSGAESSHEGVLRIG